MGLKMLPYQLTPEQPEAYRRHYKIIRLDTYEEIHGVILSAYVESGMCMIRDKAGATKEYNFGPGGIRIVVR